MKMISLAKSESTCPPSVWQSTFVGLCKGPLSSGPWRANANCLHGCGSKSCTPGEHQPRWQMDVHSPQNGAIGYAPWPHEPTKPVNDCSPIGSSRSSQGPVSWPWLPHEPHFTPPPRPFPLFVGGVFTTRGQPNERKGAHFAWLRGNWGKAAGQLGASLPYQGSNPRLSTTVALLVSQISSRTRVELLRQGENQLRNVCFVLILPMSSHRL